MDIRQDALLAGARFVDAVNRVVRSVPGRQVGTVGRIAAAPGAPNVIPGRVTMSLELRDLDMNKIEDIYQRIHREAEDIGAATGTKFDLEEFYLSSAALADDRIKAVIAESADELGLSRVAMPSGAGHDAQSIAKLGHGVRAERGRYQPLTAGVHQTRRRRERCGRSAQSRAQGRRDVVITSITPLTTPRPYLVVASLPDTNLTHCSASTGTL
jgi:acetylornithine deacetylase/succinyl-diaminopimelate desuccinylase-like protein